MPEISKPYKIGNYWTNLVDSVAGESVNFEEVSTWWDGTPMGDTKCDGVIYRKLPASVGGPYVKRVYSGYPNVKWFGAKGDGINDDTAAIRRALSTVRKVEFDSGVYVVTDEISVPNFCEIVGKGNTWNANARNTVIRYQGDVDPTKAVLRVSTSSVGVEPSSATSNVKISNIIIHANNLAGYGLYCAYVSDDSIIDAVTVRGATQHGLRVEKCWYASFVNIVARSNYGCGITFGLSGWGGCNGVNINNIRAHSNGLDEQYDPDTNHTWGYGLGLFTGADLVVKGIVSEKNFGAGIVIRNPVPVCGIDTAYLEDNCSTFPSNRRWGILYDSNSNSRQHFLRNIYLYGQHTSQDTQYIRVQGTGSNMPLVIDTVAYGKISATQSRYSLYNCSHYITDYIEGLLPTGTPIIGGYNFDTVYVRPDGLNSNSGASAGSALATLDAAIRVASIGTRITTIDCTGCTFNEPSIDLSSINKNITINGGGTAVITNTSSGQGLNIINYSSYAVTVTNFDTISRIITVGNNIVITNCTIALTDNQNTAAVSTSGPASTAIGVINCTLSGSGSGFASPRALDIRNKVIAENNTYTGFTTARFRLYSWGSELRITGALLRTNIDFANSSGTVITNSSMITASGQITFS